MKTSPKHINVYSSSCAILPKLIKNFRMKTKINFHISHVINAFMNTAVERELIVL